MSEKPIDYGYGDAEPNSPYVACQPKCECCADGGEDRAATHLAPQSQNRGQTIRWRLLCDGHACGWWGASDWCGPTFKLQEMRR